MSAFHIDASLYPFAAHTFEAPGGRLRYVDEGSGPVLVMVHGTPTWSFLYRHLITALSSSFRVIAADNLGFGRSERVAGADYRPAAHAANLSALIDGLGLEDVTLVVHDFGGPIGLSYAIERPDNVRALVLFNTWLWSLRGTPAEGIGAFMGGPVGRFLYRRLNVSPRTLLPMGFADRSKLTPAIRRHYVDAFATPAEREAPWVLARELLGSSEWYEGLWQRRGVLANLPALLLWGMKDPAFRPDALARWREALPAARVVEFPEAGHFVQEEAPERAVREIRSFLAR